MNEIIAYGQNYSLTKEIEIFIKSAKKHSDKVTLLYNNLAQDLLDYLQDANINLFDVSQINEKYKVNTNISAYTLKVIYYYLYLKHYSIANQVVVADFTDTVFNNTPFSLINNDKTYVFCENEIIKNCDTNSTWLKICYGDTFLEKFKDKTIINSGIILGKRDTVITTTQKMCQEVAQLIKPTNNYPIIDQAILNKLVFTESTFFNVDDKSDVIHFAHFNKLKYSVLERNKQVLIDNKIPVILHQYDCDSRVVDIVKKIYEE